MLTIVWAIRRIKLTGRWVSVINVGDDLTWLFLKLTLVRTFTSKNKNKTLMSLASWLTGGGEKPGYKRKANGNTEKSPPKKKFSKEMSQDSFNWYMQDESGKWHCTLCRSAQFDNAYAKGHDTPAKTRHAGCKLTMIVNFLNFNLVSV
jgi:hypothetical protein